MLASLNIPVKQLLKQKSRNHTELLFKSLKIPIKLKEGNKLDLIRLKTE